MRHPNLGLTSRLTKAQQTSPGATPVGVLKTFKNKK